VSGEYYLIRDRLLPNLLSGLQILTKVLENIKIPNCPSRILKAFFEKSQIEIDQELSEVSVSGRSQSECLKQKFIVNESLRRDLSPAELANCFHIRMLEGVSALRSPWLAEDLALVVAALPAQELAEMACSTACEHGELADIHLQMIQISEAYGLADDEHWHLEESPDEYVDLAYRSHVMLEKIYDTVFVQILERYRLGALVVLFEQKRGEFEIRYEVGRRLLAPGSVMDPLETERVANSFRSQFGEPAVAHLKSRLAEYGLC